MSRQNPFWSRVRSGSPDECWPWTGGGAKGGYGRFNNAGAPIPAHVWSWMLAHPGEDRPPVVRHRCDNPPCCNPAHLVAGTQADNMRDMQGRRRGRTSDRRGAENPAARLTEDDVREIRSRRAAGESRGSVAAAFGIHPVRVSEITNRRAWASVA